MDKWLKVFLFGEGNEWVYVVINDMIIVFVICYFGLMVIKLLLYIDKLLVYFLFSGMFVIKI